MKWTCIANASKLKNCYTTRVLLIKLGSSEDFFLDSAIFANKTVNVTSTIILKVLVQHRLEN